MKAKKVYQICLVLCGLFLSLSGIACLVVATLLNHDSDLKASLESKARTYGTQYWLGMPIIFFGGLMMLISPSLHKRKKMAAYGLFLCIPLLTCALVGSILHGTAYTHFVSIHQKRLFFEDRFYLCSDVTKDITTQCQCSPSRINNVIGNTPNSNVVLPVPCAQQKSLVGFHGTLLTFSAMAFALLLGILVICVIFLLHFFKIQLPMSTSRSGQDNEGFSHAGGRRHSIGVHIDEPLSQHPSQATVNDPLDRPPSYESLITSFDMSHGMTSHANASRVTYDVTERNMAATVNGQARVRYRGESTSRFINESPGGAGSGESSPNEVSSSINELENVEAQMAVVDGTATPSSESIPQRTQGEPILLRISHVRQRPHEVNSTTRPGNTSNELDRMTHQDIEAIPEQATSNDINEPRSEQNSEPSIEIRSERTHPPSGETISHEGNNSPGRSSSFRNSNPTEINMRVIRHSSLRTPHPSSIDHSSDMQVAAYEERSNPTGQSVRNPLSSSMEHAPLERTVSDNSEDGVYIDITQSSAQNSSSVSGSDPARIAARYWGQADSSQTRSRITREQEDTSDENIDLQERTTDEDHSSSNAIISAESTGQTTDSLNNDTDEAASTDNPHEDEIHNETLSQQDSQSISSERDDLNPHNSDTGSVSSLEIMSI